MSGSLINTEHISTYFGKGQGTYPITKQSSKLHRQARYKSPDIIIQTVQRQQKITNRLQFKKWKNYFNIRLRTGTGDVKWKEEFNAYNTSSKSCQDALSTHNTPQRTLKQSERLPILRRKMRCLPTLQDTTNPYGLRGDTPLKLSHPTPTDRDRRC